MNQPAFDADGTRSKELVAQHLKSTRLDPKSPHGFFRFLRDRSPQEGFWFNWEAALEYWAELVRLGAVAVVGSGEQCTDAEPLFRVTDRGRALLARGDNLPHDESRYMAALRKRVPAADEVALSYLSEGIGAWKAGLNRACAVMVGCACERLVLLLAEHVSTADISPFSAKLAKMLGSGKPVPISDVFTQLRAALLAAADEKRLPGELQRDVVDRQVSSVFEHARGLRNMSGHPTGGVVSAEEAEAGLLLFPSFHDFASKVLTGLAPKASPPAGA